MDLCPKHVWIVWSRVLVHFTEKQFQANFLTERHMTEKSVDRTPYDRNTIWPDGIRPKIHFTERLLFMNGHNFFAKNVIWPKKCLIERTPFDRSDHLTERSFDNWPKNNFSQMKFCRKTLSVKWPSGQMNFFGQMNSFGQMNFFV
jgi:hypothetical protein